VVAVSTGGKGIFRLHTVRMERSSDPKAADWDSYWASMTFQVQ